MELGSVKKQRVEWATQLRAAVEVTNINNAFLFLQVRCTLKWHKYFDQLYHLWFVHFNVNPWLTFDSGNKFDVLLNMSLQFIEGTSQLVGRMISTTKTVEKHPTSESSAFDRLNSRTPRMAQSNNVYGIFSSYGNFSQGRCIRYKTYSGHISSRVQLPHQCLAGPGLW